MRESAAKFFCLGQTMKPPLLLYTYNTVELDRTQFDALLNRLPAELQAGITRFVRWEDRQASLFGKLLLLEGLKSWDLPPDMIHEITFNAWKRPTLPGNLDFNISHSGELITCILRQDGRIGVDVERVKTIHLPHFRSVLTQAEMTALKAMIHPEPAFYEIWTKKEAVIKAEGKGFYNSLTEVESLGREKVRLENENWFLLPVHLDQGYYCHVAMDRNWEGIEVRPTVIE